ncbi:unnamed protein product [Echinostoma caproni]|uniref:SH3 domain-containing protein n=1 Tax=Echinostoma caproni TaxID=27848 RepID=A0A183A8E5_9TREM|nr:unnamed protein product [Echinostoma caproni]
MPAAALGSTAAQAAVAAMHAGASRPGVCPRPNSDQLGLYEIIVTINQAYQNFSPYTEDKIKQMRLRPISLVSHENRVWGRILDGGKCAQLLINSCDQFSILLFSEMQ